MSTYVYDQAWESERTRLDALATAYDPATQRFIQNLGIEEGWECLEVGAGTGSIAQWMAREVGSTGHVVATDLDTRFIDENIGGNVDIQVHNILEGPVADAQFDIAHSRFVLEHLSDPAGALQHMIASLRPGGWVVVEDVLMGPSTVTALSDVAYPPQEAELYRTICGALSTLFVTAGADPSFGSKLPGLFIESGLESVGAEIHAPYFWGTGTHEFGRLTVEQLAGQIVGAGLVSQEDIDRFMDLSGSDKLGYVTFLTMSTWGQRAM